MTSILQIGRQSRAVSINPENPDVLEIIKEDMSYLSLIASKTSHTAPCDLCCTCMKEPAPIFGLKKETIDPGIIDKLLQEKEEALREEFKENLDKETTYMKERFDFILQNEQVRASYKLREAHRERKEKIRILQQQLECKNLAGMMYVMCAERTRSKLEKLQIIERYTNYINMLNQILAEGQELILNLSRGYKTAARVDYEWQQKMKKVVCEFKNFIFHFAGGSPEQNQYFFDVPSLLATESPKEDNPSEDPIQEEEHEEELIVLEDLPENKTWWERLEGEDRPFAVFGDMADFNPPQRRATLKAVKAPKTAPKKWKEYAFHDMFLLSDCPRADTIKEEYFEQLPDPSQWACESVNEPGRVSAGAAAESRVPSRRVTTQSVDIRGNMGSILKIITASGLNQPSTKANLLGAKDSMEIASSTKVRDRAKSADAGKNKPDPAKEEIKVGSRRTSFLEEMLPYQRDDLVAKEKSVISHKHESNISHPSSNFTQPITKPEVDQGGQDQDDLEEVTAKPESAASEPIGISRDTPIEDHYEPTIYPSETLVSGKEDEALVGLSKEHADSLTVIPHHHPDVDPKINYEKICPTERCQRQTMDSFIKSLPVYMRENTFTYREQTFDKYEACTPEQIEILKTRLKDAKKKEKARYPKTSELDPLLEWQESVEGIGCQTLDMSSSDLPPCTCEEDSIISGVGAVFRMEDLIPVKQRLDNIKKECFFDSQIEFNRFQIVGQDSSDSVRARIERENLKANFTNRRIQEIRSILKAHPSLADIFQANTRC